jgi:hypothetical protein
MIEEAGGPRFDQFVGHWNTEGEMENKCSGVGMGGCRHGHAFTVACYGNRGVPSCVREDLRFDEDRQVVTIDTWPVSRHDRRLAADKVPNAIELTGAASPRPNDRRE